VTLHVNEFNVKETPIGDPGSRPPPRPFYQYPQFPVIDMEESNRRLQEKLDEEARKHQPKGFDIEKLVADYKEQTKRFIEENERNIEEQEALRKAVQEKQKAIKEVELQEEQQTASSSAPAMSGIGLTSMKQDLEAELNSLQAELKVKQKEGMDHVLNELTYGGKYSYLGLWKNQEPDKEESADKKDKDEKGKGPMTAPQDPYAHVKIRGRAKPLWKEWEALAEMEQNKRAHPKKQYPTMPFEAQDQHKKSAPETGVKLPSFSAARGAVIPDWFPILDAKNIISLGGLTEQERFTNLMNKIHALEQKLQQDKGSAAPVDENAPENLHGPSDGWPDGKKQGGWWICRSGDEATDAERQCEECHGSSSNTAAEFSQHAETKKEYEWIMCRIHRVMDEMADQKEHSMMARFRAEQKQLDDDDDEY
jgi:hypothetical protein